MSRGKLSSDEILDQAAALVERDLRRLGAVRTVDLNGRDSADRYLFLSGVLHVAKRYPLGFRHAPVDIVLRPAHEAASAAARYRPLEGAGLIMMFDHDNYVFDQESGAHEAYHHLFAQLTPAGEDWLWNYVRTRRGLRDYPGVEPHPDDVEAIAQQFAEPASTSRNELAAYSSSANEVARRYRTAKLDPLTRLHHRAFSLLYGKHSHARQRLEQTIGPLRQSPAVADGWRRMDEHLVTFKNLRIATPDQTAIGFAHHIEMTSNHRYRRFGGNTLDINATLISGELVALRDEAFSGEFLLPGARVKPGPGYRMQTIRDVTVLSPATDEELEVGDEPKYALIRDCELAVIALHLKELKASGARFDHVVEANVVFVHRDPIPSGLPALSWEGALWRDTDRLGRIGFKAPDWVVVGGSISTDAALQQELSATIEGTVHFPDFGPVHVYGDIEQMYKLPFEREVVAALVDDPDAVFKQVQQRRLPEILDNLPYAGFDL